LKKGRRFKGQIGKEKTPPVPLEKKGDLEEKKTRTRAEGRPPFAGKRNKKAAGRENWRLAV